MKDLYLQNGYLNIESILRYGMPFNFVIGGRGTGKTYGALEYCVLNHKKFIFMRRTKTAVDEAMVMNPMESVAADHNFLYRSHLLPGSKKIFGWYHAELDEKGELQDAETEPFGIGGSLVTIGKTRGLDASDVSVMIHDEFVKAPYEPKIKNEADAFFNAYETVNRNRELKGKPPVTAFLLSNSDDMVNDYFIELGLVDRVDKMQQHNENFYIDRNRQLTVSILSDSPISKAKQEKTALYHLTQGTRFSKMAVENEFVNNAHRPTKSMSLSEFRAIVKIGELVIYKHKSAELYYACLHLSGTCKEYGTDDTDIHRFTMMYYNLWVAYMSDTIIFETYTAESLFNKFFS